MWWWCIYLDKLQSAPVSPLSLGCLFSALIFPARWVCSFVWGNACSPNEKKIPRCQWCISHKYSRSNVLGGSRPLVWGGEELLLIPHTWTCILQAQRLVDSRLVTYFHHLGAAGGILVWGYSHSLLLFLLVNATCYTVWLCLLPQLVFWPLPCSIASLLVHL